MRMDFDFETMMERHGMDAMAVDAPTAGGLQVEGRVAEGFDRIPMWVADMNFPTAPSIQQAMAERIKHPAFGYFEPRQAYYDAIIRWQEAQNRVHDLAKEDIGYENGVLGGVVSALRVLCEQGGEVLVHTPVYIGFRYLLHQNGFHMVESPLQKDQDGVWRMDLLDMEEKIREHSIHAAIFCSPHNPTGRVWEPEEIKEMMALFQKYDVYVISDEIWSDLLLGDHIHIPTQSVSQDARERTVALYAPSKTFNLAGLIGSYHIIYNKYLRDRIVRQSSLCCYNSMNVRSQHALIGAYSEVGHQWLCALREVLARNAEFAVRFCREQLPGVEVTAPEGTYMLFLDCAGWLAAHGETLDHLLEKGIRVGVIWQDGRLFRGETHIRMNLALPTHRVEEAFRRLDRYVFNGSLSEEG